VTRLRAARARRGGGGRRLVSDLALDASGGTAVAVVGPSGSGKTSLLAVLAGDLAPAAGEVLVDGRRCAPGTAGTSRGSAASCSCTGWCRC
jgi:ABC-type hemin transport system ATPase subunit